MERGLWEGEGQMTERLCMLNTILLLILAIWVAVVQGETKALILVLRREARDGNRDGENDVQRQEGGRVAKARAVGGSGSHDKDVPASTGGHKPRKSHAGSSKGSKKDKKDELKRFYLWKVVTAKVTAYEPSSRSCKPYADGKTSTGKNAWRMDGCATDHRAIPKGTIVEIPGIGRRVVDDTGRAMRRSWNRGRYHVDVRMTYVWQCRKWGNPTLKVKLYRRRK